MTLCLAWRNKDEFYFASDSRLTDAQLTVTSNEATKIYKIDVEVYGPTPDDQPHAEPQLLHRTAYGLCFSGSYLNGSILADSISEVLSNIQAVPGQSDISIGNLSDIALTVYKQVSVHLMEIHGQNGLSSVFFGGFCLEMGLFKLYKLFAVPAIPGGQVGFQKQEIVLNERPVFIGSSNAIKKAEELMKLGKPGYTYFHLLRDIIKDPGIPTVGGKIQCGFFKGGTFRTNGIIEYSLEPTESGISQVKHHFNFRGLSLDLDDNELRSGDINIMKTFFDPFESERWVFQKQIDKEIEDYVNNLL